MFRDFRVTAYLPWRSPLLGGAVAALLLLFGVPIFLRMPPWADLTLYDVAAANLLRGGVHYRDVFDTNLPGFVWWLTLIRAALGPSYEAVRAVDLAIVAGIAFALDRFARDGGATRAVRVWTFASLAAFYPFLTEACHTQRDVWMLLPALFAVRVRWRLLGVEGSLNRGSIFRSGLYQGLFWGAAVWIKPHVLVPAAVVWLATIGLVWQRRGWRGVLTDFLGNVAGGAILGIAGIAYLWFSGAWPSFVEVLTFWNPSYVDTIFSAEDLRRRARYQDAYFPPWSYLHWGAVPLSLAMVLDGLTGWVSRIAPWWLWAGAGDRAQRLARMFPALLYIGWTLQAIGAQREFHYAHVPEIFLMLALFATQRWAVAFASIVVLAVVSVLVATDRFDNEPGQWPGVMFLHDPIVAPRHPITEGDEWKKWVDCFRMNLTEDRYRARMWSLSRAGGFDPAPNWIELGQVADELRRRNVRDGDLIAWNDAPHSLYLMLKIRPGFRYQHVRTCMGIGEEQERVVYEQAAVAAKTAKYAVSDLKSLPVTHWPYPWSRNIPDTPFMILPPPGLDLGKGNAFPFDRPAVFRSGDGGGRYLIHDLRQ